MSHEITATDKTLSVRQMPWMGLLDGQVTVLDDNPTRREAQQLVHPWEPVETPVFRRVPVVDPVTGSLTYDYEEIPESKAIERSDNGAHLGTVNSSLSLVTNEQMWDVAEAVGNIGSDIEIETGGSLDGGKKVWVLLKMAEPFVIKGDPNGATVAYLALQNNHDGGGAFRAQAINTRIVCANTSTAADVEAKRNGYEFTFRHSKGIQDRIEDAKRAVAMWREGSHNWRVAMEHLVTVPVSDEQRKIFVERFHPMPNERLITDRVRSNVETARYQLTEILASPTNEGVSNTAYGLVQGGIEWAQHARPTRGKDARARMENRFKRSMIHNDNIGRDALALAKDLVGIS